MLEIEFFITFTSSIPKNWNLYFMKHLKNKKQFLFDKLSQLCEFKTNWMSINGTAAKTRVLLDNNQLESNLSLEKDELPMVELYLNEEDFLVFTTQAIYIQRDNTFFKMTYFDLKNKRITSGEIYMQDMHKFVQDMKNKVPFLDEIVRLKDGGAYKIRIEYGNPYFLVTLILVYMTDYLSEFEQNGSH